MATRQYQEVAQPTEYDEERLANGNVVASEKESLVSRPDKAPPEKGGSLSSNNFLKLTILVGVTLQNTGYALCRRYSRGYLKETYSTSSALLVMEVAKLVLSMAQVAGGGHESDVPEGSALSKYVFLIVHSWKMMVPAIIYLVMNILGFVALGHLDASTFSVVAQMKVFTTAIFSVLILGRTLHVRKWRALVVLTLGVILISNEALPKTSSSSGSPAAALRDQARLRSFAIGMGASLGDVLLSGFASIYFEAVLKSKTETYSVWDRNLQLAFWSSIIYTPIMLYDNPTDPFAGWSVVTSVCAAVGALGGVLVALSIKHTDSIMKTIATTGCVRSFLSAQLSRSLALRALPPPPHLSPHHASSPRLESAIVLTTILNAAFLNGPFTLPIWTGALIVVVAVFNYNDQGDK